MSGKKSLLVDKSKMPLAMGIAFVAFTTQFGGGFASGAQIYQYFINYGIWCLLMPLITQGYMHYFSGMECVMHTNIKHMITEVFLTVYMERQDRSCQIYMKSVI